MESNIKLQEDGVETDDFHISVIDSEGKSPPQKKLNENVQSCSNSPESDCSHINSSPKQSNSKLVRNSSSKSMLSMLDSNIEDDKSAASNSFRFQDSSSMAYSCTYSLSDYVVSSNEVKIKDASKRLLEIVAELFELDKKGEETRNEVVGQQVTNILDAIKFINAVIINYDLKIALGIEGCYESLMRILKECTDFREVALAGVQVITNICDCHHGNKWLMEFYGTCEFVCCVGDKYISDKEIMTSCLHAMSKLSNSKLKCILQGKLNPNMLFNTKSLKNVSDNRSILCEKGAIRVICDSLQANLEKYLEYDHSSQNNESINKNEDEHLLKGDRDYFVALNSLIALWADYDPFMSKLKETKFVKVSVATIKFYSHEDKALESFEMWCSWLWMLVNVCLQGKLNILRTDFKDEGVFELIFKALEEFSSDIQQYLNFKMAAKFLEYSVWAVLNLTLDCEMNLKYVFESFPGSCDLLSGIVNTNSIGKNPKSKASELLHRISMYGMEVSSLSSPSPELTLRINSGRSVYKEINYIKNL